MKKTIVESILGVDLHVAPQTHYFPVVTDPISRAKGYLLSLQTSDGYWQALLEMDVRQTAEYLFLKHFFNQVNEEEQKRMVHYIVSKELTGGGWSIFPGGLADISTTVSAYYALKLAGFSADHPVLKRAKEVILGQGGIMKANCFTRSYLQLFGQMEADALPAMPVEIMLLPKWFPFNIYAISSWSRAIMVPLLVISAMREKIAPIKGPSCQELYPEGCSPCKQPVQYIPKIFSWHNLFLVLNHVAKLYDKHPVQWIRKMALRKAHKFIVEHMGREGGVAAIFPSMVNSCIALYHMGYDTDHPLIENEMKAMDGLKVDEGESRWMQPCVSTVWDTAWCLHILPELGVSPHHPSLLQAKEFLLSKQVSISGDWQEKIPPVPCGGWYFERENSLYPDTDDTAAVLLALPRYKEETKVKKAVERAITWLFAMQSQNNGWAAFDYQSYVYRCFNYIPFAEHGALLDPPTADVTARVIESLSGWGYDLGHPRIRKAVDFLLQIQEKDGSWYGRWGVNYVYGTWAVLCGLKAVGFDMEREAVKRAVRWLLAHQRPDGGWGESCNSYPNPFQKGQGESTPSQTAWSLLGLHAAGETHNRSVRKGIDFLIRHQRSNGSWQEESFTGTGFPGVCYLKYHLYKDHFPALALSRILPNLSRGN